MLHAGIMSVTGKAPFDLIWKMPNLMETAMLRMERRREEVARKEKKLERRRRLQSEVSDGGEVGKTFSENAEATETDYELPAVAAEFGPDYNQLSSEEFDQLLEEYPDMIFYLGPEIDTGKIRKTFSEITPARVKV